MKLLDERLPYCVLHGWQWWPGDLSGDLDIAIEPQHLSALESSFRTPSAGQPVQLLQHEVSGFYFVLARQEGENKSLVLVDAATDYRRDGRVFFTAEELLTGRRQWNGLWIAAPTVEFGYLLVKKVLKGAIAPHQKQRLRELAQELDDATWAVTQRFFGRKLGDRVRQWIVTENWTALESHLPQLRRGILWQALWHDPFNAVRYWLPESTRMWRRWRYPSGLCVAVLGPDGAGKSALIKHLQIDLEGAFRRSTVFHLQPDVLGRHQDDGPVPEPHAKPLHPWWLSLLKLPYYALDYVLGYALRVRPQLVRSTLVLFDRYYDDILVDARRYRYGAPRRLLSWLQRAIPRPDLFLILDAPAAQLLQRKQELPGAELRRQRLGYGQLAAALGNAYVLDASQPEAEVARQANTVLLDCLHERYRQRRHLWFETDNRQQAASHRTLSSLASLAGYGIAEADATGPDAPVGTAVPFALVGLGDGRGYLVPLESRRSAAAAMTLYNPQTLPARLGRHLLGAGLRLGVAQPFLKRVWLPTSRCTGQQPSPQAPLLTYLQDVLGQSQMTFGISLGTPGPHRKPVIQMMDIQGRILGYAKVGQDAASNVLVQNEARVLQTLATTPWQALTFPQVVATGWCQGHFLCVLSAPQSPCHRLPQRLTPLHLAALGELHSLQVERMPLATSPFWLTLTEHVQQVQHSYYRSMVEQGMARAATWLATTPIPFHFCHGDFTPWNLQRQGQKLFIVDWECATVAASPLWDLFHFIFQTLYLVKKKDAASIAAALVESVPASWPVTVAVPDLDVQERLPQSLALLYCIERLAFWARTEPHQLSLLRTLSAMVSLLGLER